MRRGSGIYAIIAVLAVLTILCGAGFYYFYLENQRLNSTLNSADVAQIAERNENVDKLKKEADAFAEERKKMDETLTAKDNEVAEVKRRNSDLKTAVADAEALRNKLNLAIASKQKEISALKGKLNTAITKANTLPPVTKQLQKELADAKNQLKKMKSDLLKLSQARNVDQEGFNRQMKQVMSQNAQYRSALADYKFIDKQRTDASGEIYDGKIIEADVDRDFAVIDLGKINRVKPGMQFDVIRYRQGQWADIASLEITKVMQAASTCVILKKVKKTNICPQCGYIADGSMRNCPYCRNVNAEGIPQVVSLVEHESREINTMNSIDPLVVGDYVTSPVYSRDRVLSFTIAGYPQEYSTKELETLINKFGGKVVDKVGAETDYLILCQVPDPNSAVSPEMKKIHDESVVARETADKLGIPVMREVELLNFLQN